MRRIAIWVAAAFLLLNSESHALLGGVAAPPPPLPPSPSLSQISNLLPLKDLSPGFLGMYRKVMEIEDEIHRYADRYGLDADLAWAVCLYESGGNANLTSRAGARGYFQVMPSTFRSLRVETNIEAGVKYLARMVDRFDREDYAIAAYNGGPTRVARRRPMALETLQYVIGVGYYRNVLQVYDASIRHHAQQIRLAVVGEDDDWWTMSRRLGRSLMELRLHNPFLANRRLRAGQLLAYAPEPRTDLVPAGSGQLEYRARHGDNYFNIAFSLDVDLDALRERNGLWRLQVLPAGMRLLVPLDWKGKHIVHRVTAGETLEEIAKELDSEPWRIIRDNALWEEAVSEGMVLRVRPTPPRPTYVTYRVTRGDTLGVIARRYGTTIAAIQAANAMGRRTLIRIGQSLRIPSIGS